MTSHSTIKMQTPPLLSAVAVDKAYSKGQISVPVLRGIDIAVAEGEFVSIVGQSGSGKSTLMHLLGLLDTPDHGEVRLEGKRIDNLSAGKRDSIRNHTFGFVFQFYHLLPELTLLENVLSPLMIRDGVLSYWRNKRQYREEASEMLDRFGLGHRLSHKPRELSGGEMQRGAIARSLITKPRVLLADEPTGNLDSSASAGIIELLEGLKSNEDLSILMVTHDDQLAQRADRVVRLTEGRCHDLAEAA